MDWLLTDRKQLDREAWLLQLISGLFAASTALSNTFVNVYLWKINSQFSLIGWFNLVGYVAMARHVPHAATFYAFFARGLGRVWGVSASFVALLSYNCIQIGLYGLIGATLSAQLGGAWWIWALAVWAVIENDVTGWVTLRFYVRV